MEPATTLLETIKIASKHATAHFAIPFKEARNHAKYFNKCAEYAAARNEAIEELFQFDYSHEAISAFNDLCMQTFNEKQKIVSDLSKFADYIQCNELAYIAQTQQFYNMNPLISHMCKPDWNTIDEKSKDAIVLLPLKPITFLQEKRKHIYDSFKSIDDNVITYKQFFVKFMIILFCKNDWKITDSKSPDKIIEIIIKETIIYKEYARNVFTLNTIYLKLFIDLFEYYEYLNSETCIISDTDTFNKCVLMKYKLTSPSYFSTKE